MRFRLFTIVLPCAAAVLLPPAAGASAISCRAPSDNGFEVTSATRMTCLAAREDIEAYEDPVAVSFRTPGAFVCTRTRREARSQSFRCVKGKRSYRVDKAGKVVSAVRVYRAGYDKVFRLSKCQSEGESDLAASGRAPGGIKLTIAVSAGSPGTLQISGGSEEDSIEAGGEISSLRVGDDGRITAKGRFTSGDLSGSFRLRGECA